MRSFLLLAALAAPAVAQSAPKPNILWLIGEDLGPDLACYGTPQVRTPHLDALAAAGVRYTRAFADVPVCSPSRSALMTGMHAVTIGAHNHRSHRDDGYRLPAGVELLTTRLRRAGYFCANLVDLTGDRDERFFRGTGKTDWNFAVDGKPFDGRRWAQLPQHQPFYAQINFAETHRGKEWNTAREHIETPADPDRVVVPPYYPEHPLVRRDWAQYLDAIMALDRKVGRVLEQLERDGLADHTIVIFFGDHGRAMVRGKQWCYDSGLRVPLLIRWPRGLAAPAGWQPGSVDDGVLSLLDVTATTLALAGVARPHGMQGRVFLGPQAEARRTFVFGSRDRCDETVDHIRTVRDARWRYIRNYLPERPFLQRNRYKERQYPVVALLRSLQATGELHGPAATLVAPRRPAEELYDLDADPHEIDNLAADPAHAGELRRLRAALDAWVEAAADQGRTPEPAAVVEAWEQAMAARDK